MEKWEYAIITQINDDWSSEALGVTWPPETHAVTILNQLGDQGWELVSVVTLAAVGANAISYYLKRRL